MLVNVKSNYLTEVFDDVEVGDVVILADEDALPNGEICMKISEVTDFNNMEYNAVNVETGELTYVNPNCAVIMPTNAELSIEY